VSSIYFTRLQVFLIPSCMTKRVSLSGALSNMLYESRQVTIGTTASPLRNAFPRRATRFVSLTDFRMSGLRHMKSISRRLHPSHYSKGNGKPLARKRMYFGIPHKVLAHHGIIHPVRTFISPSKLIIALRIFQDSSLSLSEHF
jgi:hypothetical protein